MMAQIIGGMTAAIAVAVVLGAGVHVLESVDQAIDCRTLQGYVLDSDPARPGNQELYGGWAGICKDTSEQSRNSIGMLLPAL